MAKSILFFTLVVGGAMLWQAGASAGSMDPGEALKAELEAVRKQRAELEARLMALEKRERVVERTITARKNGQPATPEEIKANREEQIAAVHKQRAELEQKIREAALSPKGVTPEQAAEFRKKIEFSKRYEEGLKKAWEKRDKGYYAKFEVRGRLEKIVHKSMSVEGAPFLHIPASTTWRVLAGPESFELRFEKEGVVGEEAEKLRESLVNKSVLITGRTADRDVLIIQSIKAVED